MSIVYNTSTVKDGLILHLDAANVKSYPGTGTAVTDMSSNKYACTLVGATTHNATGSISFDTNATSYTGQLNHISTPTIDLNDGSSYTLDFWVKLRSSAEATYHSLCGRVSTNPWVSIQTNNTTGDNWLLSFRDSGAVYRNFSTVTSWNIQQWTNVTLTIARDRTATFYLNGNNSGTLSTITNTYLQILRICGGYESATNYYPLQGSMGSCKIYSKALTSAEVKRNFEAVRGRFGV